MAQNFRMIARESVNMMCAVIATLYKEAPTRNSKVAFNFITQFFHLWAVVIDILNFIKKNDDIDNRLCCKIRHGCTANMLYFGS